MLIVGGLGGVRGVWMDGRQVVKDLEVSVEQSARASREKAGVDDGSVGNLPACTAW